MPEKAPIRIELAVTKLKRHKDEAPLQVYKWKIELPRESPRAARGVHCRAARASKEQACYHDLTVGSTTGHGGGHGLTVAIRLPWKQAPTLPYLFKVRDPSPFQNTYNHNQATWRFMHNRSILRFELPFSET